MKTKIVASSFIRRESDGKYLILKRSDTDLRRKGRWDLAGGMVDEGEDVEAGALREVAEESGLSEINKSKLLYSASGVGFSESAQEDKNFIFLYYMMVVEGSEEVVLSYEHSEYKWVEKTELKKYLTHKAQRSAFKHIFENMLEDTV